MNITITHIKEYRTKHGELEASIFKSIKGNDVPKIATLFCLDDINYIDKTYCGFNDCIDCWINELQQYNRIIDYKNRTITFEKVERV